MNENKKPSCYLCQSVDSQCIAEVSQKPELENNLGMSAHTYRRLIYKCQHCSIYFNATDYIPINFYSNEYNKIVYNHELLEKYKKIMDLPEEKSDNKQRIKRIIKFCDQLEWTYNQTRVLDVGSGLCVFLGGLKTFGFKCYCVDPDPTAIQHAVENVKIEGFSVNFGDFEPQDLKFDIISFNKVLEHIKNPIQLLKKAKTLLSKKGFIYIELPDGDLALRHGNAIEREEFYIEHHMIFNETSFRYLADKANLTLQKIGSIHEPSDKFTIYGFLF